MYQATEVLNCHAAHGVTVRTASHLDLLWLSKLAESYAQEVTEMKRHPVDAQTLMRNLSLTISNPEGYLSVLVADGEIVGAFWGLITTMPWSCTKVAQDLIVFVDKAYRGYGKLLLSDWVKWAGSAGAKEVLLSTASGIDVDKTCKLYERLGFKKVGYMYQKEII